MENKPKVVTELQNLIDTPIVCVTKNHLRDVCNKAILAVGMLESAFESANAEFEKYKVDMAALYRDETGKCYNTISDLKSENARLSEANTQLAEEIKRLHDKYDHQLLVKENSRLSDAVSQINQALLGCINENAKLSKKCADWEADYIKESESWNEIVKKVNMKNAKLRAALSNWYNWEQEQIRKEGPYVGAKINELINDAGKALSGEGKEG